MVKKKSVYVCNECGEDFPKWQGQCSSCSSWNSLREMYLSSSIGGVSSNKTNHFGGYAGAQENSVKLLADIDLTDLPRLSTGFSEFDRVLGGGLVPGSVVLIGGHPGAGKSTLLLQVLCYLADSANALYVTGEESLQQVAMRAKRLNLTTRKLNLLSETSVESLCTIADKNDPRIIVIDSIQVMHIAEIPSAPGSVSQVRESAAYLARFAKQSNRVLLLVGHVTKDGSLAGPKVLEHIIDCSLMLEGDNDSRYRTLRSNKNRFGAVNELGVFGMTDQGLREVNNPSSIFLQRADDNAVGSVVMVVWEGTRPLLVEIQALVDDSHIGNPRRVAVGLDHNRLSMLLAVLHRHGGLMMGGQDVFVNVVGGVKVNETSADLALLLAIVSSFRDQPLPPTLIVFGEVGLSGEIRPISNGQERLREAAKHGFKQAIIPKANMPQQKIGDLAVIPVKKLADALEAISAILS